LPTVALFFVWAAIAVARDIRQYNPRYVTGWDFPYSVPVDEVVLIASPSCVQRRGARRVTGL
jgi:hypothetical protein